MQWLQHSQKTYCELCNYSFVFHKRYTHSMPPGTLPVWLYVRYIAWRTAQTVTYVVRAAVVAFAWLLLVPYTTYRVWRMYFNVGDRITDAVLGTHIFRASAAAAHAAPWPSLVWSSPRALLASLMALARRVLDEVTDTWVTSVVVTVSVVLSFVAVLLLREWVVHNVPEAPAPLDDDAPAPAEDAARERMRMAALATAQARAEHMLAADPGQMAYDDLARAALLQAPNAHAPVVEPGVPRPAPAAAWGAAADTDEDAWTDDEPAGAPDATGADDEWVDETDSDASLEADRAHDLAAHVDAHAVLPAAVRDVDDDEDDEFGWDDVDGGDHFAEDIESVLEAIGLLGPFVNFLQTLALVQALAVSVITVFVAIPYCAGRLLGFRVLDLVLLPAQALRRVTDPVFEAVLAVVLAPVRWAWPVALDAPDIPDQVVHALLNLTEFMEHDDKALPISIRLLGDRAYKFHSYAKALHYKEAEFMADASPQIVELLIDINTKLQQSDAAFGALTYAREHMHITHHEEWYEKLHRWEEALAAYDRRAKEHPENLETVFGQMRCLHALGEWEHLTELVQEKWPLANADGRRKMAPLAAAAAWSFGQWDMMDEFIAAMRPDSSERSFYRAVLAVHRSQRVQTKRLIARARDALDHELTALISESYGRAYDLMVRTQMLSELEEALAYKLDYADQPDRQALLRAIWMKRLQGCELDVEVWQRILSVRSIVITPADDTETWIKFANLCRKSGRMVLAEKTLNSLLGPDANASQMDASTLGPKAPPAVIYSHLKFMWACGAKGESLSYLRDFTANLAEDLGMATVDEHENLVLPDLRASPRLAEFARLLARCYFKLGEWQVALNDEWVSDDNCDVIHSYKRATELDRDWYKAWHAWALSNFDVITHHERRGEAIPFHEVAASIVPSVHGFFRSIALASGNSLQDTLRLLTLWFKFGHLEHIADAVRQGFACVSVDTWLEVIPQMIARISAPSPRVRRLIHHLLADVGTAHPQALVYPLTVATKSPSPVRMHAAMGIMDTMREHSPVLVDQAILVSNELIRIAILWHEMWHEGLEEASRLYFTEHNIEGMFATLGPLHDLLEKGPETLRETSFAQTHGRDLNEAHEYVRRYRQYGEISDLNQAWDLYYHVFKRITKQLPASNSVQLALQYVSPKLLALRDLELAVPGSYVSGQPVVRITQFEPVVLVISSKQRPRRLKMKGSDGRTYQYLLKGHEDMRQDERVMQLFGLVNTLLSTDTESYKRRLSLRRFPVIPLSPNTGMLGWVANTDTLHILIKEYREQHKILLNIEHRLMLQMAPDYDNLTIMEKVEVFEYALDNTPGQDLYRVLWFKSRNSEAWLERRTAYMRSLATSSMAGYILGLGDRHPSNLLLDRKTGEVIHIDFGDCFEIACHRPKFPEKVPFRLTRMLIKAMEVGGVNGTFKITAENTMRVLRDNRESVLALLEAFVHDPLISWRLVTDVDAEQRAPDAREHEPTTAVRGEEGEARNQRALEVVRRIQNKLSGRDFNPNLTLSVPDQVERLVQDATCVENLCVAFIGWCAFW